MALKTLLALACVSTVQAEERAVDPSVNVSDLDVPRLKPELTRNAEALSDDAGNSDTKVFVFLQKFPLEGRILGFLEVFHTEVLVCPRSGFSEADQSTLDNKIASMHDFAEIDKSWWSTRTANCVELGYGGDYCSDRCCGAPHTRRTMQYALYESRSVIGNADTSKRSLYIYGTGDFDGNVAYHHTCDQKCWSNWAGTDYNILQNNCNTFTSTVLNSVYGLSQKKPNLGVSDLVTVHGHCPAKQAQGTDAKPEVVV